MTVSAVCRCSKELVGYVDQRGDVHYVHTATGSTHCGGRERFTGTAEPRVPVQGAAEAEDEGEDLCRPGAHGFPPSSER